MNETTTDTPDDVNKVADDFDPLSDLTGNEIDAGSRILGASLVKEIAEVGQQFGKAQAVVALLHARREDRSAQLSTYTAMKLRDLTALLEELAPSAGADPEGLDPTGPAPA